jgi:hypothetical protein
VADEPEIGDRVSLPWSQDPDEKHGTYIGHGHITSPLVAQSGGVVIGYHVWHSCKDGKMQPGGVFLAIPELPEHLSGHITWQLVSREPLHIEPSVLCRACGDHGWIRDGKWVEA